MFVVVQFPIAMLNGLFINGPYAVTTTAVSNDLVGKCTIMYIKIWHKSNHAGACYQIKICYKGIIQLEVPNFYRN